MAIDNSLNPHDASLARNLIAEAKSAISMAGRMKLISSHFIGLPYIRDARAVALSEGEALPLLPNRLTVATEDYVLSRRLYLYTSANPRNEWVRKFLDFAVSKAGQDIVAANGFVSQNVETASGAAPATFWTTPPIFAAGPFCWRSTWISVPQSPGASLNVTVGWRPWM